MTGEWVGERTETLELYLQAHLVGPRVAAHQEVGAVVARRWLPVVLVGDVVDREGQRVFVGELVEHRPVPGELPGNDRRPVETALVTARSLDARQRGDAVRDRRAIASVGA